MHRLELHVSGVRVAAVPKLVQLNLGLQEQLALVSALACLEQPVRLEPEPQMAVQQVQEPELPIRSKLPQAAER